MINIASFLSKGDWFSIGLASILVFCISFLSWVFPFVAWICMAITFIIGGVSVYMVFFKKYERDDVDVLNDLKNMMGGK